MRVSLVLLLAACAGPELSDTWRKPDYMNTPFMRVLVIGVGGDAQWRTATEDAFLEPVRARNIGALASHTFIDRFEQEGARWLPRTLSGRAIDGIITVRLVKPGDAPRETLGPAVFDPVPKGAVVAEVALWEARSWGRVWTARTTAEPEALAAAVTQALIEAELL